MAPRIRIPRRPPRFHQTHLEFTPFRLESLIESISKEKFPSMNHKIRTCYWKAPALASIQLNWEEGPLIQISTLLNEPDTPYEVMEHIIIHELLHIEVPPREIDGKHVSHPPEFWERERALSPQAGKAMEWIFLRFFSDLKIDRKNECLFVKRYRKAPTLGIGVR